MKHGEPIPPLRLQSAAIRKFGAIESSKRPKSVNPIPKDREKGCGRRSVKSPIIGCSSDAVIWFVIVIRPICPKSR